MSEALKKLDPPRTIYMRGFDGFGAAAAISEASSTGFKIKGVFRAMDDFCVVVLWDSDNQFEHYSIRYLPDFDFSGMVMTFDYSTTNMQPLDSVKFSWIDWGLLDLITEDGQPLRVPLWPYASYVSGTFVAATGSVTLSGLGTGGSFNLFVNNTGFGYTASSGTIASSAASSIVFAINTYDWSTFASASVSVMASLSGSTITLTNAQSGHVDVSGTAVTWRTGAQFQAVMAGDDFILNGTRYTVDTVTDAKHLTLTTSAGTFADIFYLAPRRGSDGNSITAYVIDNASGYSFSSTTIPLSGGVSDGVKWRVSIDFDAVIGVQLTDPNPQNPVQTLQAIDRLRQIVLTFAPQLPNGVSYPPGGASGVDWTAELSNWDVSDASGHRALKVAAPGSVRVGNADGGAYGRVKYGGIWSQVTANNYYLGSAQVANTTGNTVTIKYSCQSTHDVYIGCQLYQDRGIVSVSIDGDTPTDFDAFMNVAAPVMGRRLVRSSVAAGQHEVVLTITGRTHAAIDTWDINSLGTYFLFDFLEAVVAGDVPDPSVTYPNFTAAVDYDTDATYKMPPPRLAWALQKMGLLGQINLYLGVFWIWQRIRSGGTLHSLSFDFSGFSGKDTAKLDLGGFIIFKTIVGGDTAATIAMHFAYYINCSSVAFEAHASGAVLTITQLAAGSSYSLGTVTASWGVSGVYTSFDSGSIPIGVQPDWQVDDVITPVLNAAARAWLADFYAELQAASMTCSSAISMELVNPPSGYPAQYADGTDVGTDTGFSSLKSNHCALGGTKMIALQKAVLKEIADLKNAAGIPVFIQFGEFLWWYFSSKQNIQVTQGQAVGYIATGFTPIYVGVADPHFLNTGDQIYIEGVAGTAAANGLHTVTVVDSTHFTLDGTTFDATWVTGTGVAYDGLLRPTTPITVQAGLAHGLNNGDRLIMVGAEGITSANGTWTITKVDDYHFTLDGSVPNSGWRPGTGKWSSGSMAFYDADTTAAAMTALGRPLASFTCQDDDPSVNGGDDVAFLAARFFAHVTELVTYIKTFYPSAQFEILFAHDVTVSPMVVNSEWPFPQGGRLNRAVNFPPELATKATSGLDRLFVEALSWGASYRSLTLAKEAIEFGSAGWDLADRSYNLPIFNGGCPMRLEFLAALNAQLPRIVLWAWDHIGLIGWPWPLPVNAGKVSSS